MSLASDIKTALEAAGYIANADPPVPATSNKLYRSTVTRGNPHELGHTIEVSVDFAMPKADDLDVEDEVTTAIQKLVAIENVGLSGYSDSIVEYRANDVVFTVTVERIITH